MRILSLACLVLLVASVSCDQGTGPGAGVYDYLLFVRGGGGDKSFTVQPLQGFGLVDIWVTRYQFRDTLVFFQCKCDESNLSAFNSLDNALHGRVPIEGEVEQPVLPPPPTGTWVHLYMVRKGEEFEITNKDLKNQLLGFETLVTNHFPLVR